MRDEQKGRKSDVHLHLFLLGSLLRGLRNFASTFLGLLHGLDDTNGNGLPHVTDSETTEWWVLRVRLHTHWLARDQFDDACITRLDELRRLFDGLTRSAIDLLEKLSEFTSDVRCVAVKDRCIAGTDLTRVVQDDDLSVK